MEFITSFSHSGVNVSTVQRAEMRRGLNVDNAVLFLLQPHWPAIQRTWSEAGNTARAPGETWNCGSPRNQAWTRSCTGWTKTWPPPPTASTKSLNATWRACPPTLPTPSPCTSCPALTLWPVSPSLPLCPSLEVEMEAAVHLRRQNGCLHVHESCYILFLTP